VAIDARYQSIPAGPLLDRAMVDREAAEAMQFFDDLTTMDVDYSRHLNDPVWRELAPLARQLANDRPWLLDRAFTTRAWDAVYWMLAPNRRSGDNRDPTGLAEIAVFGAERFPCGAVATQGIPLSFVPIETVPAVAAYVENATLDLFDATAMEDADVYKSPWRRDRVVDVLARYAQLYRRAAEMDECVLVVLD
jgi:hypothetical protein